MNPGWRVKPIFQRDPLYVNYVERMVKEMRATIPKLPVKIGQEASTQAILDRPESEDEAWQNRPLPTWEQASAVPFTKDPNEMTMEEMSAFVGKRDLDPHEVEIVTRLRQSGRGHTFGDAVSEGAIGISEESRERAVNALTYSTPATLSEDEKRRIRSLSAIEPIKAGPEHDPKPPDEGKPADWTLWDIFKSWWWKAK